MIRIRGRSLPSGEQIDLCADSGVWRSDPPASADLVAEGWIMPGLSDVHTHPGAAHPSDGLSEDLLRQDLTRAVDHGVTVIRSPGLAGDPPPWFGTDPTLPRAWHAGPWLARDGAFFDGGGRRAALAGFPHIAATQALATGWVKLIGDWPGTEPLPLDVIKATADAVHAVGGRLAVHCQHEQSCHAAVFGGADSIEHGQYLGLDLIDEMVRRQTTWVPTLAVMQQSLPRLHTLEPTPERLRSIASREAMPAIITAAAEAGVTILAGTDSADLTIVDEINALLGTGLPATKALGAASWTARSFLSLSSLTEGAPADAVIYADNPLTSPATLAHPTRVILRGTVVR